MNEPNMDETMQALAEAGILDGAEDSAVYGDDDALYAAATPEAAGGTEQDGSGLTGLLGSAGPMIAAAFVGSKLSGGKSSGNPVADVVTTVTEKIGDDGKKTTTTTKSGSSKKKGILETIKSVPDAIEAPMNGTVQAMLEEFAGTAGSGSVLGEFAQAMQDISKKDAAADKRVLPSIGNVLPDAVKSVGSFIPGL